MIAPICWLSAPRFSTTSRFKPPQFVAPLELLWLLGNEALRNYENPGSAAPPIPGTAGIPPVVLQPQAFPDAGTYVLRHDDLFLLFTTNSAQPGRPASHRHNDVLSIEVSAGGRAFIVDPGTYVYTADLRERHLFRSTAYHSSVQIDDEEQQTIREAYPFAIGDEAAARVLVWKSMPERDRIVAEHSGYERLAQPATHRRTIVLNKADRWWLIEDEIAGGGEHKIAARFHFDAGLEVKPFDGNAVIAGDPNSGARLLVCPLDLDRRAELEAQFTSRQYGSRLASLSACWITKASLPCKLRWAIIPVGAGQDAHERLGVVQSPTSEVQRPSGN